VRQGGTGCRHRDGRRTLPCTAVDVSGDIPSANPSSIRVWSTCLQVGRSLGTFLGGNVDTKLAKKSSQKGGAMRVIILTNRG